MKYELNSPQKASDLARYVDAHHVGRDLSVLSVAAIDEWAEQSLTYWQRDSGIPDDCPATACVIVSNSAAQIETDNRCLIVCTNPRLAFARLLQRFENESLFGALPTGEIHPSAIVHTEAVVSTGASIGAGCKLGAFSYVAENCVLGENVKIGAGCKIGQQGFGYDRDEQGIPIGFPHLGRVVIGDDCEIGCNSTIARGNLADTSVGRGTKIDDQVYVAHNCAIGEATLVAGGAVICGSVVVGNGCWVGAGAMVRQGLTIGDNATIGLGAVVIRSVAADSIVAGNPAKELNQR